MLTAAGDLFDEADFSEQRTIHPDEVALDPQPQNNVGHEGAQPNPSDATTGVPSELETPSKPQRTGPVAGGQPVSLPPPANNVRPNVPPANQLSTPVSKPPAQAPPQPAHQNNAKPIPGKPPHSAAPSTNLPPHPNDLAATKRDSTASDKENKEDDPTKPQSPISSQIPEDKRPEDPEGGFYSGRAAESLKSNPYNASKSAPAFDPRFDSPSIRKTAGFNHNTSAPVARGTYQILPSEEPKNGQQPQNSNAQPSGARSPPVNNAQDANRKPAGATAAPVNNRGNSLPKIEPVATFSGSARAPMTTSYRPPTIRSMAGNNSNSNQAPNTSVPAAPPQPPANPSTVQNVNGKRPPLSDTTNVAPSAGDEKGDSSDAAKRPRVGDAGAGATGRGTAVQHG